MLPAGKAHGGICAERMHLIFMHSAASYARRPHLQTALGRAPRPNNRCWDGAPRRPTAPRLQRLSGHIGRPLAGCGTRGRRGGVAVVGAG